MIFTGPQDEIDAIVAWAKQRDEVEEVSDASTLDASRALNVGLPHVDPTEALKFVTLVFTTGSAALGFFKALREVLKQRDAAVAVSESTSGKRLGKADGNTSEAEINGMVSQ